MPHFTYFKALEQEKEICSRLEDMIEAAHLEQVFIDEKIILLKTNKSCKPIFAPIAAQKKLSPIRLYPPVQIPNKREFHV